MQPVCLSFVSMLQDLLSDIFDAVLRPVLQDVFNIIINTIGGLIQDVLSNFLLKIFIIFLKLIGFLEDIFGVFAGVNPIQVTASQGPSETLYFLDYLFDLNEIQTAFMMITAFAVVLVFVTTLWGVGRSMSDMLLESKNPVSQVLKQALRSAALFAVIPFACLFAVKMVSSLTLVVNNSLIIASNDMKAEGENAYEFTSMTDLLFISCAGEAAKSDAVRDRYTSGQRFENAEQVKKDFDITKINYVLAYAGSILTVVIMLAAILQAIRRLFEILLLYLTAPFFAATIPQDEGARLREWKKRFVATIFSVFGPMMMMKIYFLVMPSFTGGAIQFVDGWMGSYIQLFLVIGGAWAVYKSQHMIGNMLDPAYSGSESAMFFAGVGQKMKGKLSLGRKK